MARLVFTLIQNAFTITATPTLYGSSGKVIAVFEGNVTADNPISIAVGDTVTDPDALLEWDWTFGDTGETYDKLENVPDEFKDATRGGGIRPVHVYKPGGPYTWTAKARWRNASGTIFESNTVTGEIAAIPTRFATLATSKVIVVAKDDDFTDAPAHDIGNRYTTYATGYAAYRALTGDGILVLKGGETHTDLPTSGQIDGDHDSFYMCSYPGWGVGRPVLENTTNSDPMTRNMRPGTLLVNNNIVLDGIEFRGGWNSVTETGNDSAPGGIFGTGGSIMFSDCTSYNLGFEPMFGTDNGISGVVAVAHDCGHYDSADYAYYSASDTTGTFAVLGCISKKHPQANNGGGGDPLGNQHGPIRIQAVENVYVDAVDLFNRSANDPQGSTPPDGACIRDHRNRQTGTGYFGRMVLEGGVGTLAGGTATGAPAVATPRVVENSFIIGTARGLGNGEVAVDGPGVLRNTVIWKPNVISGGTKYGKMLGEGTRNPRLELSAASPAFVVGEVITDSVLGGTATITSVSGLNIGVNNIDGDFEEGNAVTGSIAGAGTIKVTGGGVFFLNSVDRLTPYYVYNNTLVNEYDDASDRDANFVFIEDNTGNYTVAENGFLSNNLTYAPNNTDYGDTTEEPLDLTPLSWFTPRYLGFKYQNFGAGFDPIEQLTMDYEHATPTHHLDYDGGTGAFAIGETVTAGAETFVVTRVVGSTASGTLWLVLLSGAIANDTALTGSVAGAAVASGTPTKVGLATFAPTSGSTSFETASGIRTYKNPLGVVKATASNKGAF